MATNAIMRPARSSKPTPRQGSQVRVLLIEDIPSIAAAMMAGLRTAGFDIEHSLTGADAIARKSRFRPEIVLIDLGLPDVDGIKLVERFAGEGDCGVIVVTANDETAARVAGLETGADDYVVKPVPSSELAARIRALYRRLNKAPAASQMRIFVDLAQRGLVTNDNRRVLLTEAEMSALEALLGSAGNSVTREDLSRIALKRELHADDRAVDQLVMKLRRKLSDAGASERVILSARRQGYTIANPDLFRVVNANTA
jgi:DNA-binding response OmpR family regulator